MIKTFCLITNTSGYKYWSYRLTRSTDPIYSRMIEKYGTIYVNNKGGWFDESAIKTIHKTVRQATFPVDIG